MRFGRVGAFMKRVLCVLGLGALFCGACSVVPVTRSVEYVSPEGQAAGYYPGLGTSTVSKSELAAYLAKNQAGIADVQNRIVQIREGHRRPGCIGEDKYTCVATLAQKLAITDHVGSQDFDLFADVRYDVNGRPLNGQRFTLDGFVPNYRDFAHRSAYLTVNLAPDGSVSLVEAKLLKGVELAHTQEEYDATGIYEITAAIAAKECPGLSKSEVARWVENTVKPNIHQKREERGKKAKEKRKKLNAQAVRSYRLFDSPKIAFCGRTFEFTTATFTARHGFEHDPAVPPLVRIQ